MNFAHLGLLALGLFAAVPAAAAQGCAMCYQNTVASGPQGRHALQHGILILFFPAIVFFTAILVLLFRSHDFRAPVTGATYSSSETDRRAVAVTTSIKDNGCLSALPR